ncbi:hypothetical protein IG631_03017 [Alternaria alternata]|nr:hypothetical protein IG631_03017 [Alternaria alternata]
MCRLGGVGVRRLASFNGISPDTCRSVPIVHGRCRKDIKAKIYSCWNDMLTEGLSDDGNVLFQARPQFGSTAPRLHLVPPPASFYSSCEK